MLFRSIMVIPNEDETTGGKILVYGDFQIDDGVYNNIARFTYSSGEINTDELNGSLDEQGQWDNVGGGPTVTIDDVVYNCSITCVYKHGNYVYMGVFPQGQFDNFPGSSVLQFDPSTNTFTKMVTVRFNGNGIINSICILGDYLYVGGWFTTITFPFQSTEDTIIYGFIKKLITLILNFETK